jgi:hypothetical protein
MRCLAWVFLSCGAAMLVGCGPKAPDQALQISGVIQGQQVLGFVLPQTGQIVLTIGMQRCNGVLSDFRQTPRTGLLICDVPGQQAGRFELVATMANGEAGTLSLIEQQGAPPRRLQMTARLGLPAAH